MNAYEAPQKISNETSPYDAPRFRLAFFSFVTEVSPIMIWSIEGRYGYYS